MHGHILIDVSTRYIQAESVMAPPRPHGSRFLKDRPEPTSRLFWSMRPFARMLILASFFMMVSDLSVGDLSDVESVEISEDYHMVSFNFFPF